MAAFTKTTVDANTNTAALEIFVDGALVTEYTYAANRFTLSVRASDVLLTKDDVASNVADIETWVNLVHRYCTVAYDDFAPHSLDVDDKANRYVFKLKFGDIVAIHAIVQKMTPQIEFKARPELVLTPEEFRRFRKVLGAINAYHGPYFLFNGT